jgi:hypothetical protein
MQNVFGVTSNKRSDRTKEGVLLNAFEPNMQPGQWLVHGDAGAVL